MKHMEWNMKRWRLAAVFCAAVLLVAAFGLRVERTGQTPESTTRYVLALSDDGNAYRVTVSYDGDAGIPENAALSVKELARDSAEYDGYIRRTAELLGKTAAQLGFARALDVKLVDPSNGEPFQPSKNVRVSVELLSEQVGDSGSVSVVHSRRTRC